MRFTHFKPILEQTLTEVNMSPGNLRKLAAQINAKAGMEFEMIVPNAEGADDDGDMEPDYDEDERVRDIDDAINFFDDGNYNTSTDLRRLRASMEEDFHTWQYEQIDDEWGNHGFEFFCEYLDREDPFDEEEYLEQARDIVTDRHPEITVGTDEYDDAIREALNEIHSTYYTESWEAQGRNYDYAREEFEDEQRDNFGESEWLANEGIRYASDVQNNYSDINWPYWTSPGGDGRAIEDVADNFSRAIGRPVNHSTSYHGAHRAEGHYVVEPDGSLSGDNPGDAGLEFVSPPLPVNELLSDLQKVKKWAESEGCYTGSDFGTGLHINVSVPDWKGVENLDYVKLALLLGDDYVLQQFERQSNNYCKSALELVKSAVKKDPNKAKEMLDKMKEHMNVAASKLIHSGITNKFTSINTKDGYVEFRSPGGDWLNDKFDLIEPTLLRFVVALDAAVKPDLYKQEYLKKLYKLVSPSGDKNTIEYFAKYVAGEMPKIALKSFVRQAQLQRKMAKGEETGKMWWNVKYNGQRIEVVADNEGAAKIAAAKEWGVPTLVSTLNQMTAEPLRPYTAPPAGSELERIERDAGVGQSGTTVAGRPNNPEGNWYLKNNDTNEIFYRFNAANYQDAHTVLQQWKQENPDSNINAVYGHGRDEPAQPGGGTYRITTTGGGLIAGDEYGDDQTALQRAQYWAQRRDVDVIVRNPQGQEVGRVSASGEITPTTQPATSTNQGNWGIWINANDRFANQPGTYARGETPPLYRFPSREAAEQWIEQQRAERPNMRTDIEVREIEPAEPIPGSTLDLQRRRAEAHQLVPHGPGPWELYNTESGSVFRRLEHTNRAAAQTEAETYYNLYSSTLGDISNYAVRTRQESAPAQSGAFTGEWKVVDPQGTEIYRFSGVGNSQSDANRVAMDWLRRNPQHLQGGVEVLPVMN